MNQVKQSVNLNESGAKTVWASYHCIGERATQILNSIEQPYPDISDLDAKDLQECLSLFIFTDNANNYVSEIDDCIMQYKDVFIKNIFVFDLHPNDRSQEFKARWGFYNIFISSYFTLENNIQHYLLFVNHFIETVGLICMGYKEWKYFTGQATFITAGTTSTFKHAIGSIPVNNNIKRMMLGLVLQDLTIESVKENLNELRSFFDQLPDDVDGIWQMSPHVGNPHIEYIVGLGSVPTLSNLNL